MKKFLLVMALAVGATGFAQDCEKLAQEKIIDKIKNYSSTDLVPYSKHDEKWALVDIKSKKRLTDFVMDRPATFYPSLTFYVKGCGINVKPDYTFSVIPIVMEYPTYERMEVSKSKATMDELGFQVDEKGEILAYSKEYENKTGRYWIDGVKQPFTYQGEYYAILNKEKEKVVINQKGKEIEHLRFKEIIHLPYKNNGEELFVVEDFDGKKGFITFSGRKILFGELFEIYQDGFGYSIQNDNQYLNEITISGVVDFSTQQWLIKPQKKYKIYQLLYTSKEEIRSSYDNRDKANIFFLATDGKKHFVLDIHGKPILPKK